MSSLNQVNGRTDLIAKDAMYLFELMRDSPHPFLLHIGPYAEKTGTKANSIIKRLGDIKKRNGLNIITTTNAPGDNKSYTTPRPRPTGPRGDDPARKLPGAVKQERKPKSLNATVPKTSSGNNGVKTEAADAQTPPSLPTPVPSPAATCPLSPPAAKYSISPKILARPNPPAPIRTAPAAQMPSYMPQKRTFDDVGAGGSHYANDEGSVLKKVKTETWSFS